MTHVVGRFFIMLFFSFCLLGGPQTSFAQVYDGSVGNNTIPNSYQGFDQGRGAGEPINNAPPGPNPCEFQDPLNPICPIDDYMYVLVAVGIGYGFIKFRKQRGIVA